ncbi:MAG: Sensor histidine kinase RcsC [Anaerolineae bacterium]|nr:Sensor histidine kinase RcsC [Anaerolineae bacterium]
MNTNGTVLIVDDEPVGRKTLKALLFTEGYDLAFAANGPEALALAAELNPDVILLDVMMPGMDGFEVCRRLRAMPDQAEVPIIMVTALDDRAARLEAIEAGADDFITKPFDRVELRARVQAVIRLNRYRKLLQERTRRREAEEEARRQENELLLLQEVKRLQDEFISNASHELRTPLATITLISGNLDALYDKLDDDRRHKMIQDIRKQARALNQLIDGVLDISRLDQGRISGERHSLDLAGLVLEEIERQRPLAEEKSHRLMVAVNGPLPVWGDAGQLRQIVRNLLNNAIKYTPAEGRISCQSRIFADNLAADPTWPGSDQLPEGSWVGLRVVDNGVGIAPEQLTRLFERFYRVQPQSVIPGTGLGLAIAKELTELHRGRIAVVSQPGSGTTFAIYLPVADA